MFMAKRDLIYTCQEFTEAFQAGIIYFATVEYSATIPD